MKSETFIHHTTSSNVVVKYHIKPIHCKHQQEFHNYLLFRFLDAFKEFDMRGMNFEFLNSNDQSANCINEIAFNLGGFHQDSSQHYSQISYLLENFGEEFLSEIELINH